MVSQDLNFRSILLIREEHEATLKFLVLYFEIGYI